MATFPLQTENQKRKCVAYQFELQAHRLFLSIKQRLPNFRYLLFDEQLGREVTAVIVPTSWDFYEYRLNRTKQSIELLIVQKHSAVVPIEVISLEEGRQYQPGQSPTIKRLHMKRPNHEEMLLFVSKLLLGLSEAEEALKGMHPRTRQRYLKRRNLYLSPRIGRPVSS